jgi:hypothetical protein
MTVSVGQAVSFPVQTSAGSQGPVEGRHTMPDSAGCSVQAKSMQAGTAQRPELAGQSSASQHWPGSRQTSPQMREGGQQTPSPRQTEPSGQHSPSQHWSGVGQQSSPQMVMPVEQHLPPAVHDPLQQPSMAQVVVKPSQGSGGRVVGAGAWVVVVVGVWRMGGGLGRLP